MYAFTLKRLQGNPLAAAFEKLAGH